MSYVSQGLRRNLRAIFSVDFLQLVFRKTVHAGGNTETRTMSWAFSGQHCLKWD